MGVLVSILLWVFTAGGSTLHADRLIESFRPPTLYRWHAPEGLFSGERLSLDIPWLWSREFVRPPMLLEARGENRLPVIRVMNLDEPIWLPLRYATRAAASQLKSLGEGVNVVSETVFRSPEGIRMNLGEVHWRMHLGSGLPLRSLFVSTFHKGRWVLVNVTTRLKPQEAYPAQLKAMALSLKIEEE